MEPQSLGVTYWFDTEPTGDPYSVSVHLQGRRHSSAGTPAADFSTVTTVGPVVPGSGPISVTTRITDAQPGTWDITATPVRLVAEEPTQQWEVKPDPLMPVASTSGGTLFAPINRALAPGVLAGAWPAMVSLGAVLGLGLQFILASRLGLPTARVTALTLMACLLGVLGAKTYYLLTHPHEKKRILTSGMSVQGFVISVVLVLLLGSWALSIPSGSLFDVSAPGLLLGMAVGRLGCLLGGCCAGRPTRSRWGLWSSDRRLGARRIPVQLLESATALLSCVAAAAAVVAVGMSGGGLVFLTALAAYIAVRQVLFPLRDLPRVTTHGRQITLASSLIVALAAGGLILR
jgi:phosphatidylglycerol:prolipoprotein diacylglycerol transferase